MSDFMSIAGPLRFYFGASYGSAQTALRRLGEPHVILSYITANNRPWDGIEDLFIDSGAFSAYKHHDGYKDTPREYVEWVQEKGADRYALRDIPCDAETRGNTGLTVREHQKRTVEMHAECLDVHEEIGCDAKPITVVQGQTPEEYLEHLDMHNEAGTLGFDIGIGSLAGRPVDEIEEICSAVYGELSHYTTLHGFGVTPRALTSDVLRIILDSADSSGWSYGLYAPRIHKDERMFHVAAMKFIEEKRLLHALFGHDDYEFHAGNTDVSLDVCEEILTERAADVPA